MKPFRSFAAILALFAAPVDAAAVDLSPAHWPEAERLRLEAREAAIWPTETRIVLGKRGMVSATASPVAAHAGAQALREGGTAADAVVATALTQIATMAGANVSFAGVAELLYFDARTGRVSVLDAGWNGWRGEHDPHTIPASDVSLITGQAPSGSGQAGRKTLVPGFMAGMGAVHARFGKLPWRRLFDPALFYAEQGVPVTPMLAAYFRMERSLLEKSEAGRAFLLAADAKARTTFVLPGLAETLRTVAEDGPRAMYSGRWARDFVDAVRAQGGAATMADMRAYRPLWLAPLTMDHAGGTIAGPDASNPSGCAIMMALNMIGHAGSKGPYWQDAEALRTTSLAVRIATVASFSPAVADFARTRGLGEDCCSRTLPAYGAAAAANMDMLAAAPAVAPAGHHSASVVAVDRWGNVAALVHSSNTVIWGDSGMIVDGVPVPMPAGLYQQRLAAIAPGARLPGDMAPMILMREGKPVLALATIGSSLVQETVRLMLGVGGGGDLAAWLAAPPLLLNPERFDLPPAAREELLPVGRYTPDLLSALRQLKFGAREVDAQKVLILRGTAAALRLTPESGREAAELPGVIAFAESAD